MSNLNGGAARGDGSDEFRALNTDLALALGRDVSGAALAAT
jgi:hypothetical protein